jgi:hypothetical protein
LKERGEGEKEWKYIGGGELVQGILYTYRIITVKSLVLMHDKSKS